MTQNPVKCPWSIFISTRNLFLPPQSPLLKVDDKYACTHPIAAVHAGY